MSTENPAMKPLIEAAHRMRDRSATIDDVNLLANAAADELLGPEVSAAERRQETKEYTDGTTATGPGPLPDQSPAQQDAAQQVAPPPVEPAVPESALTVEVQPAAEVTTEAAVQTPADAPAAPASTGE